jgi:hypothetical protein
MKSKSRWMIYLIILIVFLAFLSFFYINRSQQINFTYDTSPQSEIIYSDLRWYGGIPPANEPRCLGQIFPSLRVWGDGMVFYVNWATGQSEPSYWSGHLTPNQIHSLLVSLASKGFFSGWTPEMVNPAGQFLNFGVHIASKDVECTGEEPQPTFYNQIIEQIMPQLLPVDQQAMTDFRITNLIDQIQSCTLQVKNTTVPKAEQSSNQPSDAINTIRFALELPELPLEFVETTRMLNSPSGDLQVEVYQDSEGRKYSIYPVINQVVEIDASSILLSISPDIKSLSSDELKAKALNYTNAVIPDFDTLQSSLVYEGGEKGDNYFYSWYGEMQSGYMNRPFLQIGMNKSGILFAFYNTLSIPK